MREYKPTHIVGGYDLPRELWQRCGLCTHEHGRGYVVGTAGGLETHIGQDCGRKHLGAEFKELERQFAAQLEARDKKDHIAAVLAQRTDVLKRAEVAIRECDLASQTVAAVLERINREPTLAKVLERALLVDGAVRIEWLSSGN
ncbi:MAG: hypothetical protein KIT60_20585 [Burkholderiaceae bacterium]|nr:hypothetical protein [Burkholderiaceae bacterium]